MGDLWEAAVKSTKFHLKRVIGERVLTYQEMHTLLTQIEGILNSRLLCILSGDDLDPLTPGHFLIGQPLIAVPDAPLDDINNTHLSRWQTVQKLLQCFWERWRLEYVTTLQRRSKWTRRSPNIKVDDIVLIIKDNLPPTQWKLGRITTTHPGKDGLVRVATLTTKGGTCKRPISKLAVLSLN